MRLAGELLRIAVRNVGRNRRRTAISGATIALGVTAIVFANAYIAGLNRVIEREATETRWGAINVQRVGYGASQDLAPLDLDLPQSAELVARLERLPQVSAVTPCITFVGSVSNGETSTMFLGSAFDTRREAKVRPRGPGGKAGWLSGPGFSGPEAEEVVLGTRLARGLHVRVGDTVTLLVQTQPGAQDAMDLTVAGTYDSRDVLEGKHLVAVPLPVAQRLLHMRGRVTGYAVALRDLRALDDTAAAVRRALAGMTPPVEVATWEDQAPFYRDITRLFDATLHIVVVVVFALAMAGVVNTMLMAVFERTREIGTLMALGFRRRRIVTLFLLEAAVLGVAASLVGAALGAAVVLATRAHGLLFDLPSIGALVIRPVFSPHFLALIVAATVGGALVGGLYPAYRASRLRPVEALHAM